MSDVQTQEFTVKDVNTEKGYIRDINGAYLNLSKFGAKDPQGKKLEIKFFMPGVTYRCAISKSKDGKYSYVQAVISSSAGTSSVAAAPAVQVGTTSAPATRAVFAPDTRDLRMSKAGVLQAAMISVSPHVQVDELFPKALELAKKAFNELWNGEQEWK